jgi:transcriptional regulator with XRE-family HTH domain
MVNIVQYQRLAKITYSLRIMSELRLSQQRGRLKIDIPNPIDIRVGARLRLRRNMLGITQVKLGEMIGLTFQQVQNYERGISRIGASRLYELSRVLDVPVLFFFDDTDPVRAPAMSFAEPPTDTIGSDPLRKPETLELVQAFFSIEDETVRRRLMNLIKVLVRGSDTLADAKRCGG